jgi:CelD/BcsL family acetyltransferase involved in cellulose biosynthesis
VKINLIRGEELTREDARLWSGLQEADDRFANPYFSAQYTRAVASVRDDVFVGVLQDGGRTVGFFPFQRDEAGVGRPVGGKLSDYQGVLIADDVRWTAEELLDGCGLARWEFNHLLASQRPFHRYHTRLRSSPAIDLSDGYEAYAIERRRGGSHVIGKVEALRRKIEREVGTLRYAAHTTESDVLGDLMNCKSAQYRRRGVPDIFSYPWVVNLLRLIHATQSEEFAGMLSALYAGDELIAAHFGMRSRTVWHYWFPCFRRKFAAYSPGLVLLLEMIRSAPSLGVKLIDFGKGDNLYKQRFMNTAIPIAEGAVTISSFATAGASAT